MAVRLLLGALLILTVFASSVPMVAWETTYYAVRLPDGSTGSDTRYVGTHYGMWLPWLETDSEGKATFHYDRLLIHLLIPALLVAALIVHWRRQKVAAPTPQAP
jgi:hypothetical protein